MNSTKNVFNVAKLLTGTKKKPTVIPTSLSSCKMTRGLHWNRKQEMCITKLSVRVWSPAPNSKSPVRSVCCKVIHWHHLWKTSSSSGCPQDLIHFISKQEILGEILILGLHFYNSLLTKEGSTSVLFKYSDQTNWIPYLFVLTPQFWGETCLLETNVVTIQIGTKIRVQSRQCQVTMHKSHFCTTCWL